MCTWKSFSLSWERQPTNRAIMHSRQELPPETISQVLTWVDASYLHLFFFRCDFYSDYPWNWTVPHQICGRKYRPFLHLHHYLLGGLVLHTGHTIRVSRDLRELHRQSLFLWTREVNVNEMPIICMFGNICTIGKESVSADTFLLHYNYCFISRYMQNASPVWTLATGRWADSGHPTLLHSFTDLSSKNRPLLCFWGGLGISCSAQLIHPSSVLCSQASQWFTTQACHICVIHELSPLHWFEQTALCSHVSKHS